MLILVRLIGIVIACAGVTFLFSPKTLKEFMIFWTQGRRLYIVGILRLLIGIVLLSAASQYRLVGIVVGFGILFLIGGITLFILGLERCKDIIKRWHEKPIMALRLIALIPIIAGILLLYSA